ncbi:hypothetical protein [Embleya sp. NPDC059237]|uniref:hypothetical protein n=1 Tax=Embleya sp. NPDC059237 TaxID=3346784 RepID=UPI0036C27BA7
MADSDWTHVVRGEAVTLPGTLGGIRAALPADRRAAFDEEMYSTPLEHLARRAILGWALPAEAHAESEEDLARIRAGDYTGVTDGLGNPVRPPGGEGS